jgi:hypothetical protein
LKQNVDLPALIARGWDPESRVFAPLADDPLFGYLRCERVRCPRAGESRRARALGLCDPCAKNFLWRVEKTAGTDEVETLERFKTRPLLRHDQATTEQPLCLVCRTPGHERAARTKGLCTDCCRHRAARRQTAEEFVAGHARLGVPQPRPSFGRCLVDDCRRWATNDRGFCQVCYRRWKKIPLVKRAAAREGFLAAGPWQPPLDGWRAAMPVVPELVQWQLLAGLQLLIDPYGVTMALDRLAMAWAHVAKTGVGSVGDLSELPGTYPSQRALEIAIIAARRLTTTPEEERAKDVWDLGVFGLDEKRAIDFTNLHQRWLRDAAKGYTIERLAHRKTRTAQQDVVWLPTCVTTCAAARTAASALARCPART